MWIKEMQIHVFAIHIGKDKSKDNIQYSQGFNVLIHWK